MDAYSLKLYHLAPAAPGTNPQSFVLRRTVHPPATSPVFWFTPDSAYLKFVTRRESDTQVVSYTSLNRLVTSRFVLLAECR